MCIGIKYNWNVFEENGCNYRLKFIQTRKMHTFINVKDYLFFLFTHNLRLKHDFLVSFSTYFENLIKNRSTDVYVFLTDWQVNSRPTEVIRY